MSSLFVQCNFWSFSASHADAKVLHISLAEGTNLLGAHYDLLSPLTTWVGQPDGTVTSTATMQATHLGEVSFDDAANSLQLYLAAT